MPFCINVTNVNEALGMGLRWLFGFNGVEESSRNGPVRVSPEPVMTTYYAPRQRVLFSPVRDANPFFHLFESLWMLAGREDLALPMMFNKRFAEYSDNGKTLHGAYGHRWRNYFGYDQLDMLAKELKRNPASRRCVLGMWDNGGTMNGRAIGDDSNPMISDLDWGIGGGKDIPCNTHIYFRVNNNALDITVLCRSNDVLWGAYGANAVHFSILQEYMAARVGLPVGRMYQFSNNFHVYPEVIGGAAGAMAMAVNAEKCDLYQMKKMVIQPLVQSAERFDKEVVDFCRYLLDPGLEAKFEEPFLRDTALPMYRAWSLHKQRDYVKADLAARAIWADDWREASVNWIQRRRDNWTKKEAASG